MYCLLQSRLSQKGCQNKNDKLFLCVREGLSIVYCAGNGGYFMDPKNVLSISEESQTCIKSEIARLPADRWAEEDFSGLVVWF